MIAAVDLDLFRRLLDQSLHKELPGSKQTALFGDQALSDQEINRLLGQASILAAGDAKDKALAFEIASRVLTMQSKPVPAIESAVEFILAQLGNFPARQRLHDRMSVETVHGLAADLSIAGHEGWNTVKLGKTATFHLTDEQRILWRQIAPNGRSVAFSAPTSGGKSFLLILSIVHRLLSSPQTIVYVVPSRALIRQVIIALRDRMAEAGIRVPIRGIPIPVKGTGTGVVYVLTQERLVALLQQQVVPSIDFLIVDEAHQLGREARGVLLEDVIQQVRSLFPAAQVVFGSPPIKNPQFFLDYFSVPASTSLRLTTSPVFQNYVRVQIGFTGVTTFTLMHRQAGVVSQKRQLPSNVPSGTVALRAWFAAQVTVSPETTIVYANAPAEATAIAKQLREWARPLGELSPEIKGFVHYLKTHVHPDYDVAAFAERGIAVHHGKVPTGVRARLEKLVEAGAFRFVICTSTLLAGVNLPAKHIVIARPRLGPGQPMDPSSFRNLAGRAGRLKWDLYGNVWLLEPEKWWREELERGEDAPATSAYADALGKSSTILADAIAGKVPEKRDDLASAVLSKALIDHMPGRLLPGKTTSLQAADLDAVTLKVPLTTLQKNIGINPVRLDSLYQFLLDQQDLSPWIPSAIPSGDHGLDEFEDKLRRILFETASRIETSSHHATERHVVVASQWLRSRPLRLMIQGYIDWSRRKERKQPNSALINEVITFLEDTIRYRTVRDLRAYVEVLTAVLTVRGDARRPAPWHLYAECGTADSVTLALMSLGLSRMAAIEIRRSVSLDREREPEAYEDLLRAVARSGTLTHETTEEIQDILGAKVPT